MSFNRDSTRRFDAVIIGGGIGGLTCGNYLAKAGRKVLLIEQHSQVGGYCASFRRKRFIFNAAAQTMGGFGPGGRLSKILADLNLIDKIEIKQFSPSDKILGPDFSVLIYPDWKRTLEALKERFQHEESGLVDFFGLLMGDFDVLLAAAGSLTFEQLYFRYLSDTKLLAVFNCLFANIGATADRVSAMSTAVLLREFIFDGGYYTPGGLQTFSNALLKSFQDFGGEVLLSSLVNKIIVHGGAVGGVVLENGQVISSDIVVSNSDARRTFLHLVGQEHLEKRFCERLMKLTPSPAAFTVYLGLKKKLNWQDRCNHFIIPDFTPGTLYNPELFSHDGVVFLSSPTFHDDSMAPEGCDSLCLTVAAPFRDPSFWQLNKARVMEAVIDRTRSVIPDIHDLIQYKEAASPQTFYRYTLNSMGAAYGWDSLPQQVGKYRLPLQTDIQGLYLAGHWTLPGPGILNAAYSGFSAARQILRKRRFSDNIGKGKVVQNEA